MNSRFFPKSQKDVKPGLEKLHRLVPNPEKGKKSNELRESMPNSWFYDEKKTDSLWNDIEQSSNRNENQIMVETNPFRKIDESAHRIRSTILNFELQDQEFLLQLMDLQGESSGVDHLDQESFLLESKLRLSNMIEEHLEFSERQVKLLDSLLIWFAQTKESRRNENGELNNEKQSIDVQSLKELLETIKNSQIEHGEKATLLHQDIVQNLSTRVNEYQKEISQRELTISQMNQEIQENKKKGRRSIRSSLSREINWEGEMVESQRKIIELQQQITKLRSALSEFTSNAPPTDEAKRVISSLPYNENYIEPQRSFTLEQELEIEAKLKTLSEQVKNLKLEGKEQQEQIVKSRQNELLMEKKIALLERQKKALEGSLQAANKKQEQIETSYKQKLSNAQKDTNSSSAPFNDPSIDLTKKYETMIQELKDQHRAVIQQIQEQNETRLKDQMVELSNSIQNNDHAKLFDQTIAHYNDENERVKREYKDQIKDMKAAASNQIMTISKQYEKILNKKQNEMETMRMNIDNEVKNKVIEIRIELEDQMNQSMLESKEQSFSQLSSLRSEMSGEIQDLKAQLISAKRERDSFRSIIESANLGISLDIDEEEDSNQRQTSTEDVLFLSLQEIKEKEIEKQVSEKYALMLKSQKESLMESKQWEIEQAKQYYLLQHETSLNEIRSGIASKIHSLYDTIPSDQPILEEFLSQTLFILEKNDISHLEEKFQQPTIPISEVENKVSEMREKIIELMSENEVLKKAFKTIQLADNKSTSAIFNALTQAAHEEAVKIAKVATENNDVPKSKSSSSPNNKMSLKPINLPNLSFHSVISYDIGDSFVVEPVSAPADIQYVKPIVKKSSRHDIARLPAKKTEENFYDKENGNHTFCSHCAKGFSYNPDFLDKKIIFATITSCPRCNSPVIFSDDIDQNPLSSSRSNASELIVESEYTPSFLEESNSGLNTDRKDSSRNVLSSLRINESRSQKGNTHSSRSTRVNSSKTEKENNDQEGSPNILNKDDSNDGVISSKGGPEHIDEQAIKPQFSDMDSKKYKIELDKALEQNSILKKKLKKLMSNMNDIETFYSDKIAHIEAEAHKIQTQILGDSIDVLESAHLLDNSEKSIIQKIDTSRKITKDVIEMPISQDSNHLVEAKRLHDESTEITPSRGAKAVNDLIAQTQNVLKKIKGEKKVPNRSLRSLPIIPQAIILKLSHIHTYNQETKLIVRSFIDELQQINVSYKNKVKGMINYLKNMNSELQETISSLKLSIQQKDDIISDYQAANAKLQRENDELNGEVTRSISAIQKLSIENENNEISISILRENELLQNKHIKELSDDVLSSRVNETKSKTELDELKVYTTVLENEKILSSRSRVTAISDNIPSFELVPPFVLYTSTLQPAPYSSGFALLSRDEVKALHSTTPSNIDNQTKRSQNSSKSIHSNKVNNTQVTNGGVSRPTSSISRPILTKSISKPPASIPVLKNVSIAKECNPAIQGFDFLVPLVEKDNSHSIIAYVTRYVKTETTVEKPKSSRSVTSTKMDNPSRPITIESLVQTKDPHTEKLLETFSSRIKSLESVIKEKTTETIRANEKLHAVSLSLYQAKQEITKSIRREMKSNLLNQSAHSQLKKALDIVSERDNQISALRRMLNEYKALNAASNQRLSKIHNSTMLSGSNLGTVFSVLASSSRLTNMEQQEIKMLERLEIKRSSIIVKEREKLMKILSALELVNSSSKPDPKPIIVSSVTKKKPNSSRNRVSNSVIGPL